MANEIHTDISVRVENGAMKEAFAPGTIITNQAAIGRGGSVQIVGTAEEPLYFGDVSVNGLCILYNLDPANYVEWGPESGGAMVICGKVLPAGEPAVFRLGAGVVLRAKAHTAPCKVMVSVYEN